MSNRYGPVPMQRAPWPPPADAQPSLAPPTFQQYARAETVGWAKVNAYMPYLTLPTADFIAVKPLDVCETFSGNAANAAYTRTISFSQPAVVFATAAAVIDDTGADLPVSTSPLNLFTVDLVRTNGDRLTTQAVLGGCVFGTAERPRLVGPSGWIQDRGSAFSVTITPLRNNLRIDLCLSVACIYGPASYAWRDDQIPAHGVAKE